MTAGQLTARITGEGLVLKFTGGHDRPTREEIARLAFHFYERRGRKPGRDIDDWLMAEQELRDHYR
jgi:hypothetical protein